MEKFKIPELLEFTECPQDLFLPVGQKIMSRGDILNSRILRVIEESGVTELWAIEPDDQDTFIFDATNRSISLDSPVLRREGELQQSLYDDRGRLVQEAGERWTKDKARKLLKDKVRTLYLRRNEDLVNRDRDRAQSLMRLIEKLRPAPKKQAAEMDPQLVISGLHDRYIKATPRSMSSDGIEELASTLATSGAPDGRDPLKGQIDRVMDLDPRSPEAVEGLRRFHKNSVDRLDTLCRRLISRVQSESIELAQLTRDLMASFIKDRHLLLNALHLHEDGPVSDRFIIRQNMNRGIMAVQIATEMGYSAQQIYEMSFGAFLHDIGMLRVPRDILLKPGPLNEEERAEIFKHPTHSLDMLQKISGIPITTPLIAYQCHERGDRSGYPRRKGNKLINQYARVVMVADMYCALTSPRPHRKAYTPHQAMSFLITEAKYNRLDMDVVKAFVNVNSLYPVGSWVVLTNNHIGRVTAVHEGRIADPVVRTFFNGTARLDSMGTIDVAANDEIRVKRSFDGGRLRIDTLAGV